MDGQPLGGGNNTEHVVRVGDTVRRSRSERSAAVAGVLRFLESAGYPHAPRHLGVDRSGRDVLTYIPGTTADHPDQRHRGAYREAGRMLRALHDLTRTYPALDGARCLVHGDPGPFNTICRDGMPVAFVDWDSARPGDPLEDLGYLAWTWCVQAQVAMRIDEQAVHLRQVRDGYGDVEPTTLISAIIDRQTAIETAESANGTDRTLPTARRRHAHRAVAWAVGDRDHVRRNVRTFLAALQ